MATQRARWVAPVLAFVAAIVVGPLGIATNVVSDLVPEAVKNPWVGWPAFAGLLLVSAALAYWAAQGSSPGDGGGPVHGSVVGSTATAGSGTAVVGGAAPTFVGNTFHLAAPSTVPDDVPVVVGDLPGAPPAMQHRTEQDDLATVVQAGESVGVVCAVGGRGVGKTQLAAAVARTAATAWAWSFVAWVSAEEFDSLISGLAEVADRLGVSDPEGDDQTSARRALDALRERREPGLLVVDNALDVDRLRPWLPTMGATRVVITTNERAMTTLGSTVEIGAFSREESVRYLEERTGLGDSDGAADLAEDLGDLPVALSQAASALDGLRLSYAEVRRRLAEIDLDEVLVRRPGEQYPRGAAEAILLSIEALEPDETVTRLLETVAVLSSVGVERTLLVALVPDVERALERVIGASLLLWSATNRSAVTMHRLVARVVRDRARRAGRLDAVLRAAVAYLHEEIEPPSGAWKDKERLDGLVDHVLPVWHHTAEAHDGSPSDQLSAATGVGARAIWYLDDTANSHRAIDLGRQLYAASSDLDQADSDTLAIANNLANAYESVGRLDDALPLYEATWEAYRRVLGPEHRDTLLSANNLAGAYESVGRVGEAVSLYEATWSACRRVLGPEHQGTLRSANNLAGAYESVGRVGEAVSLYEATSEARERVLGPEHPETLRSANNLAYAYESVGRVGEAVSLYEATLQARERVLGPEHPETLLSANNLAYAYESVRRVDEAIELYEAAVESSERVHGSDHPTTRTLGENLARARGDQPS